MIKLIVGPMGAGKSSYLIDEVDKVIDRNEKIVCFKPEKDSRVTGMIKSRNGNERAAIEFKNEMHLRNMILNFTRLGVNNFAIDEVQFIDVKDCKFLMMFFHESQINVIMAGLNQTSECIPFESTSTIAMFADEIKVISGICKYCKGESKTTVCKAEKNQQILVGGDEIYEQTCYACRNVINNKF